MNKAKWDTWRTLSDADSAVSRATGDGRDASWDTQAVLAAVRAGGDANFPTTYGRHLIDSMIWKGEVEGVAALIRLGALVEHPDASLPSLYCVVASARRTHTRNDPTTHAMVALLIAHGAGVYFVHPVTGNTMLAEAALLGDAVLVRTLLDAGADPCSLNREGESPVCLARSGRHVEVEALLLAAGAIPLDGQHDATMAAAIGAFRSALLDGLREDGLVLHKQDYGPPRDSTCDYYFYWDGGWREARAAGGRRYTLLRVRPLDSDDAVIDWMKEHYAQCSSSDSEHAHFVALQTKLKPRPSGLPVG